MNEDDQIISVCADVTKIMVKYPELFRIVEIIKSNIDDQGYIRHAIEVHCGLRTIARVKNKALMTLWWSMPTAIMEQMKKVLIKDILYEYLYNTTQTPEWRDQINKMFKAEGLYW